MGSTFNGPTPITSKGMEMDKRWCDMCGKSSYATKTATVQWYEVEDCETSLCKPCVKAFKSDGLAVVKV
jgi:uncharacterized protein CbrC (UPF0167 family)